MEQAVEAKATGPPTAHPTFSPRPGTRSVHRVSHFWAFRASEEAVTLGQILCVWTLESGPGDAHPGSIVRGVCVSTARQEVLHQCWSLAPSAIAAPSEGGGLSSRRGRGLPWATGHARGCPFCLLAGF